MIKDTYPKITLPAAIGHQLDGDDVTLHGIETQGSKERVKNIYS